MTQTQAETMIELLNHGSVSRDDAQAVGIKNPSSVVCKLRKKGVPVKTHRYPITRVYFYFLECPINYQHIDNRQKKFNFKGVKERKKHDCVFWIVIASILFLLVSGLLKFFPHIIK